MVMRVMAVGMLVVLASGCSSAPPVDRPARVCDASGLDWSVGQVADEPTMRRLYRDSGAGLVNPIGPRTIVSKDLRRDRLRVFVDKDNIITAARCE